ncbi:hypothetical protein G5714_023791 [Onychostoma macrolepis]|uniref:Ubiquitin-like domain-containing protein n=2 Tax=Onychostoma macrolepis TaxID=369639 RepID=A0A7J6BKA6_9TELE|nr:hypothetical protein G5714_023791 [Onychostoma macrolepis]
MTLKEFRRRFCAEEQDLRFIFTGRQLEDDRTLGSYDINDCSTIYAVIRVCGGAPPAEDEGGGMSRTASMERIADMQQTEPQSTR